MSAGVRAGTIPVPQLFGPNGQLIDADTLVANQLARPGHLRAYCKVYMNGQDLTSKLDPVLLSVRINDKKFGASTASMTLDDAYGKIPSPPDGSRCSITLGWPDEGSPKVFNGVLSNVVSYAQRPSGRLLDVEFTSYDMGSDGKSTVRMNFGSGKDNPDGNAEDIPFSKVAKALAEKAGIKNFNVAPSLADVKRKYWNVANETPLGALERFARELGGSFKVDSEGGGIADPKSNQAADGTPLTSNVCLVGQNVLAWRIIPSVRRAQWGSLWHGFFDRDKAASQVESDNPLSAFGFGGVQAKRMGPFPTNDKDMAKTSAKADAYTSVAKRGTGWTVVDGMPTAAAGGKFDLNGYKPGVDGLYTGEEVEHSYFRGGGFISRIDVEDPQIYDNSKILRQWTGTP